MLEERGDQVAKQRLPVRRAAVEFSVFGVHAADEVVRDFGEGGGGGVVKFDAILYLRLSPAVLVLAAALYLHHYNHPTTTTRNITTTRYSSNGPTRRLRWSFPFLSPFRPSLQISTLKGKEEEIENDGIEN